MWIYIKRLFFKILRKTPADMEMVKYWKTSSMAPAKLYKENGIQMLQIEGEKYPFLGFPRGHLLYGKLSKLKHEVKNQIFNESWALLEEGKPIVGHIKECLPNIYEILHEMRFEIVPVRRMAPAAQEIHRAWTKVSPETSQLRDVICLVFQDDDGYRLRLQWAASWMHTWMFRFFDPVPLFIKSLWWLEQAEVIGDMKERIRLLRRVLEAFLEDKEVRRLFTALFREIKWRKVKMTKADKYFFRAKYFKVDLDKFDY